MRWLILLCSLLEGCTPSAVDFAKALAGDPAAICVHATYVYGSIEVSRNHGCDVIR